MEGGGVGVGGVEDGEGMVVGVWGMMVGVGGVCRECKTEYVDGLEVRVECGAASAWYGVGVTIP